MRARRIRNRPDSLIVNGTKDDIRTYARDLVRRSGTSGVMIGADCTLPGTVDVAHIQWVVDALDDMA